MIDCDIHPALPGTGVLLPYLDDYWREQVSVRAINRLDIMSYPPKAPLSARNDWRPDTGKPGGSLDLLRTQALDRFGLNLAICNVIYGAQIVFSADLGAALCAAINQWVAVELLDKEPRLRASILVPMQDPELAAQEIEKWAGDHRFVQVLMLAGAEMPLGRRHFWPVYRAAERHGFTIGLHPGNSARVASTYTGWPSFFIEEYAAHTQTFQGQLLSLLYEGVFTKFPALRFVLLETGVTWLPAFLSRADHTWRAMRSEVPWVDRSPTELVREHVRLTAQPFDCPRDAAKVNTFLEQLGSDEMLLFATDYPHWQFDDEEFLPHGLSAELVHKMTVENPLNTYSRLKETLQ